MRTRTRFAILFACIGIVVTAVGVAAIYEAVGLDSARRVPAEAEALLGAAAKRSITADADPASRLEDATESLIAARALLAESRVMGKDAVVRLALEVAGILGAVMIAAALAFLFLSRLITKGLDELAAGALIAQGDPSLRFDRSSDPDLDAVAGALNELLDLTAEQERRLGEAARLEGWREVASFLAHQLKNPLAAILLAAGNGSIALGAEGEPTQAGIARESMEIVGIEARRLRALIDRFRDLAPSGLEAYDSGGTTELRALLESCAARAERSGASVSIRGPSGIVVSGEANLLEQAFWNLFANSMEAAAGASIQAVIEILVKVEGRFAHAIVTDSNRGIDPALLARLGRERLTTKAEGTGLGLILVKRIFAASGGSLELFATEAGGLGARASLPLAPPERKAL